MQVFLEPLTTNGKPKRASKQDLDHELKKHMMSIHFPHPYFGYIRMVTELERGSSRQSHESMAAHEGTRNAVDYSNEALELVLILLNSGKEK